jgi:hypothetical protein
MSCTNCGNLLQRGPSLPNNKFRVLGKFASNKFQFAVLANFRNSKLLVVLNNGTWFNCCVNPRSIPDTGCVSCFFKTKMMVADEAELAEILSYRQTNPEATRSIKEYEEVTGPLTKSAVFCP